MPSAANGPAPTAGKNIRLDAMSVLASTLVHELSQPLAAASNFLYGGLTLLRQRGGDSHAIEMIEQARAQASRVAEIIRRTRDFILAGTVTGERVDIRDLVRGACEIRPLPVDVTLTCDLCSHALEVRADRIQVEQVLVNLLANAVEILRLRPDAQITLSTECNEALVLFRVADNGPGISDTVFDSLFEPFFTTRSDGTGLGLALCRTIIEAHGGRIWAERPAEGGAAFLFTLPRA